MAITLSPETQRLVEDKLQSGVYHTADEVVVAALQALNEVEGLELDEGTLDGIDRAEDQIERGEVYDWGAVREQVRDEFLGR